MFATREDVENLLKNYPEFKILLIVAWGTAEILLRPLGVMPRSLHSARMRAAIASRVFIGKPS